MSTRKSLHVESTTPEISPVTRAVRRQILSNRGRLMATALIGSVLVLPQIGATQAVLDEIIVTAAKREQNMQEVPIAITALDSTALQEQGISSFEDYALTLSNIAFKSFGKPANATIYMRGAADGGDGNASGSTPSVGLYLDEQPVTAIAANLDVHIYDIARIEALAGPQGTLYGASSQSGTLRIITNKPDPSQFSAGVDLGGFATKDGDPSYSIEGFVNAPISDNAAIRLVGWSVREGGWIDNVAGGIRTFDLPGPRQTLLSNDALAKDDINKLDKIGMRAALKVDLNDSWTVTAGVLYQNLETEGVWEHDTQNFSEEGKIQRFNAESSEDEFTQLSLTIEGEFAGHSLVYAGSFMDRESQYVTDYSAYGDYLTWVPYYACDYTGTPATDCTSLNEFYIADNKYERTSQEIRLLSQNDGPVSYTFGIFFQSNEHKYFQQWWQPDMAPSLSVGGAGTGLYFRTDQTRKIEQTALFGEVTFDMSDTISATIGARWFDEESKLQGVVGWGPGRFAPAPEALDVATDSKVSNDDTIFKFNLTWQANDDVMLYATWSEGYRPGGINRDPGLIDSAGTQTWVPDILTNVEFGWKTTLADGRVRFNGAAYFMDWDDIQYTVYDFDLSACCGNVYNLSTAEITGIEADLTFIASDGWTITASVTFNDAKTTSDFILPSGALSVPNGTALPNVPEFKGSLVARYEFPMGGFDAYAQIGVSHTGDSMSEITPPVPDRRFPGDNGNYAQSAFTISNLRAGVGKDGWGVDVFINNLTDESADFYVHPRNYEYSIVTNRPISFGAKYWKRF